MHRTFTRLLALAGLLGSSSLVLSPLLADETQPATTRVTEAQAVDFSLSDLESFDASDRDSTSTFITDTTFGPDVEACGCGKAANCDCKKMKELEAKAAGAYKGLFFENNFDYLCDPCYDNWHLGERLKRNCLGDWGVLDVGGQLRLRNIPNVTSAASALPVAMTISCCIAHSCTPIWKWGVASVPMRNTSTRRANSRTLYLSRLRSIVRTC